MVDILNITIPNVCKNELQYSINCIFKVFLGLEYILTVSEDISCTSIAYNSSIILLPNYFFRSDNTSELFCEETIPTNVRLESVEINKERYDFVNMYGSEDEDDFDSPYELNTDLFAATFFMLTRWEENVSKARDSHNRFSVYNSIAFRNNFIERPIVNEYVELIWALLIQIGYEGERLERHFNILPTHDIDHPFIWNSTSSKIKSLAFSTIKEPNISDTLVKIKGIVEGYDLYDNYRTLMLLAEDKEVCAYFNFMSGGLTEFDPNYDLNSSKIKSVIKDILERGHKIGFHPSYDSYDNESIFQKELKELKIAVGRRVDSGRQHFLRFNVPATWNLWDKFNFSWDSTMGYSEEVGFRCGVCYPFPVYDIVQRKQLDIIERPLLVMDVTLAIHNNLTALEAIEKVNLIKNQVKKYNGEFVFLWHNSSFTISPWVEYESVLKAMYN